MMKRVMWTIGLLAMIAGCSDNGDATSEALTGRDRDLALKIAKIDPAAGKGIAAWCAGCHGLDGVSASESIPHLADQLAYYLFAELKAYKDGGRDNATMSTVVRSLGEDAMMKVAAYYASLEPPAPTAAAPPPGRGPVQAGRAAAAECAGCHGEDGNSDMEGTPSLAGHHPADLIAAMHAYKDGSRDHPVMQSVMESFSEDDINNIALFYAVQKPRRTGSLGSGDPVAGERTAAACAACHGEDGNSSDPNTPTLAGEDASYLVEATKAYRDGTREYLMMKHPVASLSDQDIENLAAFYASQEPKAPTVRRPLTTEDWVARCNRCHGDDGKSTDPRFPRLSAQHKEYVQAALKAYQSEARRNSMMRAMTALLSEAEIENLAAYYASRPRVPESGSEQ